MILCDAEFLKKLEYLSLVSRRVFRGKLLAQRRTWQLGSGVEFADHREYTPGDDFRYLDWHVFARHDALLLKRFQEEEDLHVYLLLDCSRSMGFGSPPKFDFARQVAAALAYIALADLDRVAVLAFAGDVVADFPLTRGKACILALLKFLQELPVRGQNTELARVARSFVSRNQRQGLVIVVSDLYDQNGFERGVDLLRHRRYEPHLIQVFDRKEADPELWGDLELVDCETDQAMKVTVSERSLRQYKELYQQFQESVGRYCRDHSLGSTRTPTDVPFDQLILQMMRSAGRLL